MLSFQEPSILRAKSSDNVSAGRNSIVLFQPEFDQ